MADRVPARQVIRAPLVARDDGVRRGRRRERRDRELRLTRAQGLDVEQRPGGRAGAALIEGDAAVRRAAAGRRGAHRGGERHRLPEDRVASWVLH